MKKIVIGLFLVGVTVVQAAQSNRIGQDFAKTLLGDVKSASKTTKLDSIPGFVTATPEESSLDADNIGDRLIQELGQNKIAQSIKTTAETRESYHLDLETNPLFTNAAEAINNPEKAMSESIQEEESESQELYDFKTCEEGGGEYTQSCRRYLEITLKIEPEKRIKPVCLGHWKNWRKDSKEYCKSGCKNKKDQVTPKVVTIEREEWIDDCQMLESLADQGICRYVEKIESPKNETRTIQGEPITRDCFEETYVYACHRPVTSSCQALKTMGCEQVNSRCKLRENGKCVVWEQTYRCSKGHHPSKKYTSKNASSPFCLTGNCVDSSYEDNNEMFEVMSQLSVLQEVQKDMEKKISIFEGKAKKCSKNCVNFKDCCGTEQGWGTDIGLVSCTPEEKELQVCRKNHKCVRVGTYCAVKEIGCLRKETSFCC
ncbi:MAG: conjugal transfer protein TraN, partial [Chlamydiales bacterium]|nr:conjugal transfer protein TraN [Chlamydiales bacterium]